VNHRSRRDKVLEWWFCVQCNKHGYGTKEWDEHKTGDFSEKQ
jgi:hypothetical protein